MLLYIVIAFPSVLVFALVFPKQTLSPWTSKFSLA